MILDELAKLSNRTRATELLKECKKRESEQKMVAVRKDAHTVLLIPEDKARERGLIK